MTFGHKIAIAAVALMLVQGIARHMETAEAHKQSEQGRVERVALWSARNATHRAIGSSSDKVDCAQARDGCWSCGALIYTTHGYENVTTFDYCSLDGVCFQTLRACVLSQRTSAN